MRGGNCQGKVRDKQELEDRPRRLWKGEMEKRSRGGK